jgi:signal transduction histidine kinase
MNDMLARIESGQAAQRRFVGDASHELRSPLATIISAVEVGLAHPELPQAELARDMVLPEAQRMQALIDDLLLLARSDERGIVVRREDVDLDDLAAQEVARVEREGRPAVRADLSPTRVVGDRSALGRVLRNLVDNAVRHARSIVEVAVWVQDGSGCVSVADDGPGIAVQDRDRIFERFVRLDTDRSRTAGGSGLGLAIVAEIVAAHHGRVTVDDRPHGGTAVTVYLPLDSEPSR